MKPKNVVSFALEKNEATKETVIASLRHVADRLESGELEAQTAIIILVDSDEDNFWTHSFGSSMRYREGIAALEIAKTSYIDALIGRE